MQGILNWFEKRAEINPNEAAVINGENGRSWTYSELNQRAKILAANLRNRGIKQGDRIALIAGNSPVYFELLFACMRIGAIFVPLNWRLSPEEVHYILGDCQPKRIYVHPKFESLISTDFKRKVTYIDSSYEQMMNTPVKLDNNPAIQPETPLAILYTGGTTGKPKGVVLTHQSIAANALNTIVSWNLTKDDITLTYLPMFHTGGLNALSLPILKIGGTVVIADTFEPDKAISLINEKKCTVVLMVPTMYHMMIHSEQFKKTSFPSVKVFISGGAPCPYEIYKSFEGKGLGFKEGYGLTEAGPNNFFISPDMAKVKRGSVGKSMILNEVKIVKDCGEEAVECEVGELLIRGNHVFSHYWNKDDETKKVLVNDWLYTGDLAKRDKDGYFYIVGRKKEVVITGGENVYPSEVEQVILEHPAVHEVTVIGLPDPKWGEIVVAVLACKHSMTIEEEQLKDYCLTKLGSYKVPKRFVFVRSIPKTPVGKIDKQALKRQYGASV